MKKKQMHGSFNDTTIQCDQKKIAKCLSKLPKNDYTRKIQTLTTLQKLPKNVGNFGKVIVAKGFKNFLKIQ